jgi:hypothetical protein
MIFVSVLILTLIALSVFAGFAVVFIYLPRWLAHRFSLTPTRKMTAWFALVGFLIPVIEAKYAVTHTEILSQSMWLWPSSLALMGFDRSATSVEVIVGFTITHLSNIGLYASIGYLLGVIRNSFRGRTA